MTEQGESETRARTAIDRAVVRSRRPQCAALARGGGRRSAAGARAERAHAARGGLNGECAPHGSATVFYCFVRPELKGHVKGVSAKKLFKSTHYPGRTSARTDIRDWLRLRNCWCIPSSPTARLGDIGHKKTSHPTRAIPHARACSTPTERSLPENGRSRVDETNHDGTNHRKRRLRCLACGARNKTN